MSDKLQQFTETVTTWHNHICACGSVSSHFQICGGPGEDTAGDAADHGGHGGGNSGIEELLAAVEHAEKCSADEKGQSNNGIQNM